MIGYILDRCKIAIREKKFWFCYAAIGIIIYFLFILIFPSNYIISSSINFNIDDSDKLVSIPGRSVWRQINRLVGAEQSFLATQVNNMPAELQEKIMKQYIDEVQKNILKSNSTDPVIRHRPQTMVLRFISLSADNLNKKYILTYKGDDYSLGVDLINYFTSRLVNYLFDTVDNKIELFKANETSSGENIIKNGIKRAVSPSTTERIQLSEDEIKIYKFLLERISTFKNTEPEITSGRDYSLKALTIDFILAVIVSLLTVLAVILGSEFSSKHLTSEVQAARYLNSHIIGTLREIKSISGKK